MSSKIRQTGVQTIRSKHPDTLFFGVPNTTGANYTYQIAGLEELVESTGHPWPPRESDAFQDIGGDFGVRRYVTKVRPAHASGSAVNGAITYVAKNMLLVPGNINFTQTAKSGLPVMPSDIVLNGKGAIGWNRFKPTRPKGGIDQFVGELHDLPRRFDVRELIGIAKQFRNGNLPSLGHLRRTGKEMGGNYLNYQFGWAPFVSDIQDLIRNVFDQEKNLQQLLRDNGRPVRRGGVIDVDEGHTAITTTSFPGGYSVPAVPTPLHELPEVRTISSYSTEEYRFSGRFRYWIRDPRGFVIPSREKYQLNRILYGGEINAATLYHLMPWSWLIDWFSSTGAIVDNFVNDSVDSLVADYAYVTGHKKVRTETTITGKFFNGPAWSTFSQVISETKRRKHASPYGFGLNVGNLSFKRQAILAALGLTKLL